MSQGQGGRGGTGHTLLYCIGLDGKEGGRRRDRTAQVARCTGQGGRGRKDRRTRARRKTERKTEGQKNRKKGARGPEKARKLSPAALEQPYRASGAMLQLSCSIVTELLEKVYGRGWESCRNTLNDAVWHPTKNIFCILFGRYKKNRYLCNAFRKHGRLAQLV